MCFLISFDPGKEKCGLILADIKSNEVIEGKVVSRDYVLKLIRKWIETYTVKTLILGNGTTSKHWYEILSKDIALSINLIEEANTTLRARYRYFELWPRNHLLRFIPLTLVIPPKNLDAVAALILLEDYSNNKFNWKVKPDFRTWPEQ